MTHNNPQKIAVVAVHGVSDQKPFESARAIANLLLDPTTNKKDNYRFFNERFFRIGVRLKASQNEASTQPEQDRRGIWEKIQNWRSYFLEKRGDNIRDRLLRLFNDDRVRRFFPSERGDNIRDRLREELNSTKSFDDVNLDFTRDRLDKYDKSTVYDSICLEGECTTSKGETQETRKVHIYEMHWADLSRLGTGFVHIFGELFQLLFHLSSLGRPIIDSTRIKIRETGIEIPENSKSNEQDRKKLEKLKSSLDSQLQWWGRFQVGTGFAISLLIPILNLCLLIAAFLSVPVAQISAEYLPITALISTGIILTILTLWGLKQFEQFEQFEIPGILESILSIIVGAGGVYLLDLLVKANSWGYYHWITIVWGLLLIGICWIVLIEPFDRYRPGTKTSVAILGIPLIAWTLLYFLPNAASSPEGLTGVSLNLIEIIYLFLCVAWLIFNALYFFTLLSGLFVYGKLNILREQTSRGFNRVRQILKDFVPTFVITQLSLVLPAVLFLFLTLTLWLSLASLSDSLLLETEFYQPLIFSHGREFIAYNFVKQLTLFSSASPISDPIPYFIGGILLIMVWFLLPAIWTDIRHPKHKHNRQERKAKSSKKLGDSLTNGFSIIIFAITIFCVVVPALSLGSNILTIFKIFKGTTLPELEQQVPMYLQVAVYILTASTTSLIAFGNRLENISLRIRSFLDTILDVDNYFRLHPQDDTPRARIFARYVSLLRYLYEQSYDAIIIVSHSQGTVITADLLSWLSVDLDRELEKYQPSPAMYIFTMGSPLKQLYGYAFRDLYSWVSEDSNKLSQRLPNVKEWVNTYRSGDYIGRYIWSGSKNKHLWRLNQPVILDSPLARQLVIKEYCIGVGGHTHYWNTNAPEIAKEIDRLINPTKH